MRATKDYHSEGIKFKKGAILYVKADEGDGTKLVIVANVNKRRIGDMPMAVPEEYFVPLTDQERVACPFVNPDEKRKLVEHRNSLIANLRFSDTLTVPSSTDDSHSELSTMSEADEDDEEDSEVESESEASSRRGSDISGGPSFQFSLSIPILIKSPENETEQEAGKNQEQIQASADTEDSNVSSQEKPHHPVSTNDGVESTSSAEQQIPQEEEEEEENRQQKVAKETETQRETSVSKPSADVSDKEDADLDFKPSEALRALEEEPGRVVPAISWKAQREKLKEQIPETPKSFQPARILSKSYKSTPPLLDGDKSEFLALFEARKRRQKMIDFTRLENKRVEQEIPPFMLEIQNKFKGKRFQKVAERMQEVRTEIESTNSATDSPQ